MSGDADEQHGAGAMGPHRANRADRAGRAVEPDVDPVVEPVVDPDVDLHAPSQRAEVAGGRAVWQVLTVIACGGALGATGRYALTLLPPAHGTAFPWVTLLINVLGCALIGALLVWLTEGGWRHRHPLLRPFLDTGVLGGFTTFSTYAVDGVRLFDEGAAGPALGYLAGTLVVALGAVWLGVTVARRLVRRTASGSGRGPETAA